METPSEEDCLMVVQNCTLAARAMLDIDVPAVLREIEKFDAFGPFFAPTEWINSRGASDEKKALLQAALPLWRWAQQQKKLRNDQ